jgi:hypothetical protein
MKLFTYTVFLIFTLSACSSEEKKPTTTSDERIELVPDPEKNAKDKFSPYPEMQDKLNKTIITKERNYYKLIPSTDSTCKIEWGNTKLKRISEDFDFYFARRLSLNWENKDFLVLEGGSGSDTWFNLILPLDTLSGISDVWNPMAYNKERNLIAIEGYADTILVIRNIKTGKSQPIIDGINKCESVFNHYCIDSISIQNKEVYIKWIIPHKMSDDFKVIVKRVKVKI